MKKTRIIELREEGCLTEIAKRMDISKILLKVFADVMASLKQKKDKEIWAFVPESNFSACWKKEKRFCSDSCRNKWWNTMDEVDRKARYECM